MATDNAAVVRRDLQKRVRELELRADNIANNLATLIAALNIKEQRVNQAVGPLTANTPLDVTITWPAGFPDTAYGVIPTITTGNAVLGQVHATPKSGTKTKTDCVVTVLATVAVASLGLEVIAVRATI